MKNLTRRGVATDLSQSPYVYTYIYRKKPVYLFFSSKLHLKNFAENRDKNHAMIYNYIYKRFKFKVDCTFLSDFNLYRKIETRGCYIRFGKKIYKDLSKISLK